MSFLNGEETVLTLMIKKKTMDEIKEEINLGLNEGAMAFGFGIGQKEKYFRQKDVLKEIFSLMGKKPMYLMDYRRDNKYPELSDDDLAKELLDMLDAALPFGPALMDVPGDLFCESEYEVAMEKSAVKKQKDFIEEIHNRGGEVIMSSHVLKYVPKETVLTIGYLHKERGADISKIVTNASTETELDENLEASLLLKRKLGLPYLFLCNGNMCKKHRRLNASLGSCMFLVTEDRLTGANQPNISLAKKVLDSVKE